jgi:hypothetical protein
MDLQIIKQATKEIQVTSQNSKPLEITKDAFNFKNAIKAPKIASITFDDTKGLIKQAMLMVGLKVSEIVQTSDLEKQIIVDFLKRNFDTLTTAEFVLAFEMAVLGKLDCEANCYQNFSIAYISKILTAYRQWANKTYNDNRHILEATELPQLPPCKTDWKEYCELTYQQFLTGNYNTDVWALEMYQELESCGFFILSSYEDFEADAECKLLKMLENKLFDAKLRGNKNEVEAINKKMNEINLAETSHIDVINLAKKDCVIAFFEEAKNAGYKNIFVKE